MKKIIILLVAGLILLAGCTTTPPASTLRESNDIDGPVTIRGGATFEGDVVVDAPYTTTINGPTTLAGTNTLSGSTTLSNVPFLTMSDGAVNTTTITPTITTISRITSVNNSGYSLCRTVWTLANYRLSIVDSGANGGHAAVKLMTFPEGHIKILSGHQQMITTVTSADSISNDATFDFALGTEGTATDNETLASAEQDITGKEDGTLSSSTLTFDTLNATAVNDDGSDSPTTVYLNCAITATKIANTDDLVCTGTLTVNWLYMGDD